MTNALIIIGRCRGTAPTSGHLGLFLHSGYEKGPEPGEFWPTPRPRAVSVTPRKERYGVNMQKFEPSANQISHLGAEAVPVLEVRDRKGGAILRAEGSTAIYAAVSLRLIRWAAIVLLALMGVPFLP
jgi:hypothetical protein